MLYETYQKGSYQVIKFKKALTLNSDITESATTEGIVSFMTMTIKLMMVVHDLSRVID